MGGLRQTPFALTALAPSHWPEVRAVYAEGMATGMATFETELPSWEAFDRSRRPDCRLVALDPKARVVGWAALSPVSPRAAYAGVAEVSIYVAERARGAGVGTSLLTALVDAADAAGLWTLQATVFPENAATLRLHEKCGFRVVGRRERIGRLHGHWRDTVLLERRGG